MIHTREKLQHAFASETRSDTPSNTPSGTQSGTQSDTPSDTPSCTKTMGDLVVMVLAASDG
jgi:hypothetical protein